MKSPSRAPLQARNGRNMLLQDANYLAKKEKERRRLIRLQQVRLRSAEAARAVRQRVKREQIRQIEKIAKEELKKYVQKKTEELVRLETEYQNALRDIGLGHEGVKEHLEFQQWKAEQAVLNKQVAEVRGDHAIKVVQHQRTLKSRLEEEKANLRKCVKLTEDARAAEVRASKNKVRIDPSSTGKIIEIDPYAEDIVDDSTKRVRFASDGRCRDPNITVKPLGKENVSGVEAAIREETSRRQLTLEQKKAARLRGLAALKRAKMVRQRTTESYFDDTDQDQIEDNEMEDYDAEVTRTMNASVKRIPRPGSANEFDEVDLIPSRGPSASSTIIESDTSSMHATISRPNNVCFDLREIDVYTRDHQPTSPKDIVGQTYGSAFASKSNVSTTLPVDRSDNRTKSKQDQDFISKVLEGFELSNDEELNVDVQIEERSTLQSSAAISHASSSSSSDITKERFLSKDWETHDIRTLIGTLRSDRDHPERRQEQAQLRTYIEKLLKMKREEIVNLSITETSQSSSSGISHRSNISEPSRSTSTSPGFTSSTPASILVSSSNSSSGGSKASHNKSVRFLDQDTLDASYQPTSTSKRKLSKAEEAKKKEIIERTRLSLEKVQAHYEEQRKRLEAQLEAKRKQKQDFVSTRSPLSEGILSTTTTSTTSSSLSGDKQTNSSAKESNDEINVKHHGVAKKSRSQHAMSRQMISRLNKSSSSGTTSSSIATEELLIKLKELEVQKPKLQRPPRKPRNLSDEQNTSADLVKATDLDSSPDLKVLPPSSFHFTSDAGEHEERPPQQPQRTDVSHITLTSSSD